MGDELIKRGERPAHKVGIKLLTEQQLKNVLPSYQNLLERIENHRKQIIESGGDEPRHYQYNMMYDNVFSILGQRGTGKTSVAFTLHRMFLDNEAHPYDVVMPIIIPEGGGKLFALWKKRLFIHVSAHDGSHLEIRPA